MECNRDEATRAKDIAIQKVSANNMVGAKKFVLKAQSLYPNLEGLPQMLAIIDVCIAAKSKICGESDWYGILGVAPNSDEEAIRKQYRKLALALHPDKNKLVGAEAAFKHISEAWRLLSDKTKRVAYDNKRFSSRPSQQSVPPPRSSTCVSRPPKTSTHVGPTSRSSASFWTACDKCKMQYEFASGYVNLTIRCPHCLEPFVAVEIATPKNAARAHVKFCVQCNLAGVRELENRKKACNANKDGHQHASQQTSSWA